MLMTSFFAMAQSKPKKKVIYEYKKFERFDFEEIGVEGD
jgi:peptidoglycan biosynthesis protein MviN/MurJ (putative lipid II flippase)